MRDKKKFLATCLTSYEQDYIIEAKDEDQAREWIEKENKYSRIHKRVIKIVEV